jgi:Flp pilus assembly protein TadB
MDATMLAIGQGVGELTSFGAAGLMGAMWLWERRASRQREEQLDEAHARIMQDRVQLDQLIDVVRQNSEAMARLSATQEELMRRMEGLTKSIS